MLDLVDLCQAWNLPPVLSTWQPETGTIHYTLLLKTAVGNYALRAYRYAAMDRGRIVNEHAITSYVQARGLPALAPLPLPNGESILEREGRFLPLLVEELETVAAVYGWMRIHDLWYYKAVYLEDNQRVRTSFQAGPFIPFEKRWADLRRFLRDS